VLVVIGDAARKRPGGRGVDVAFADGKPRRAEAPSTSATGAAVRGRNLFAGRQAPMPSRKPTSASANIAIARTDPDYRFRWCDEHHSSAAGFGVCV